MYTTEIPLKLKFPHAKYQIIIENQTAKKNVVWVMTSVWHKDWYIPSVT